MAPDAPPDEAFWREFLTTGSPQERAARRVFARLPADPRCRICAAPFAGWGAPLTRILGKRPSSANPSMCNSCNDQIRTHRGGAEIEATFLFADVRGSTALAETMSAGAFRHALDRFYAVASNVVFSHDGVIDKFVGDEVVALFFPLLAGDRHASSAVAAAQALLRATGHDDPGGPWLPVGIGVHTGRAWFGAVGEDPHVEVTALGDAVNTTARLAAAAGAGEILIGLPAVIASGFPGGEPRTLDLKGKAAPVEARSVRAERG